MLLHGVVALVLALSRGPCLRIGLEQRSGAGLCACMLGCAGFPFASSTLFFYARCWLEGDLSGYWFAQVLRGRCGSSTCLSGGGDLTLLPALCTTLFLEDMKYWQLGCFCFGVVGFRVRSPRW